MTAPDHFFPGREFIQRHHRVQRVKLSVLPDLIEPGNEVLNLDGMGQAHRLEQDGFQKHLLVDGFAEQISRGRKTFQKPLHDARSRFRRKFIVHSDLLRRFLQYSLGRAENPAEQNASQPGGHFLMQSFQIFALRGKIVNGYDRRFPVVGNDGFHKRFHFRRRGEPEEGECLGFGNAVGTVRPEKGDELIHEGLCIAHSAVRRIGDHVDGGV